jgi:hypothetical protein
VTRWSSGLAASARLLQFRRALGVLLQLRHVGKAGSEAVEQLAVELGLIAIDGVMTGAILISCGAAATTTAIPVSIVARDREERVGAFARGVGAAAGRSSRLRRSMLPDRPLST